MNRRNFLGALLGFAVLPSAKMYQRVWKATQAGVVVPLEWTCELEQDLAAYHGISIPMDLKYGPDSYQIKIYA